MQFLKFEARNFAKSIRAFGGPCQKGDEVDQPFL